MLWRCFSGHRLGDPVLESLPFPRVNKFREYVDLYLPYMLNRAPDRTVSLRRPVFPDDAVESLVPGVSAFDGFKRRIQDEAARLLEWWLNYTITEYDLLGESRLALIEALVKGRGLLFHEMVDLNGNGLVPVSMFESVDNLFIDGSCTVLRDAEYIFRKRKMSYPDVAEMIGVYESTLREATGEEKEEVLEFYEVYSRIGIGGTFYEIDDELRTALDSVGRYVYLILTDKCEYPLNVLPSAIGTDASAFAANVEWPILSYGNTLDPWPFTVIDFRPNADNPWASSPLLPGLPYQLMLDELYEYIYESARQSLRRIVMVPDSTDERIVEALESGRPFDVLRVPRLSLSGGDNIYHVMDIPPVNGDVFKYVAMLESQFERAVGLDPVLYGTAPQRQIRSAAEASARYETASARARAMSDDVEYWLSRVAVKEGMLTRIHVPFTTTARLFGEEVIYIGDKEVPGGLKSKLWSEYVNQPDPMVAAGDYEFSVVHGSAKVVDKAERMRQASFLLQTILPVIARMDGGGSAAISILKRVAAEFNVDLGFLQEAGNYDGVSRQGSGDGASDSREASEAQRGGGRAGAVGSFD